MADILDLARVPMDEMVRDLRAQYSAVNSLIERVGEAGWESPTPSTGWSVRDQAAHLVQGEELAGLAVADPDGFEAQLVAMLSDLTATLEAFESWSRSADRGDVLARLAAGQQRLAGALADHDAADRLPWVAGKMAAASFARARVMETWAHGQDIADAVGESLVEGDRTLRHVVQLGVKTRAFSFQIRQLEPPTLPCHLALTSVSGQAWTWGPDAAADQVRGSARDFALVVTRRRHVDDTGLQVRGDGARQWMEVAQCFAGPPTDGRAPGTFADDAWTP